MTVLLALLRAPELRRFLLAGAFNTALSYAVYVLLDRWLPYVVAYLLAYAVGVVVQFLLFSRYVFRARAGRAQALAYPLLHVLIAGFGSAALWLIVRVSGWPSSWAGLAAIAAQVPVAFLLTRWWFGSATAPQLAWRWFERFGVAALLGGAALFVTTGLLTLYQLGFRRPLWDQFRSYQLLLETAFPGNVLQAENGHRPIVPNLLKLLDLYADGAHQGVLVFCGGLFALLAFGLCASTLWRERALPPLWRAAGVLGAALALFWLANARMLLHGNESVAVYWVLAWLACGLIALARSARTPGAIRLAALSLVLGCFGFGNGPVIGCTLLLLAALLRRPWRQIAVLAASFIVVLLFYTVLLPGQGTARSALALHPAENAVVSMRWLSGAWVQAWLGLPEHPSGFMRASMQHHDVGSWLIASADWLARGIGDPLQAQLQFAFWLGAAGAALLVAMSGWTWWRPLEAGPTRVLGLGLAWFALGTAVLVGMSRSDYFVQLPRQVFAERYLPWSCVYWLGLLLAMASSLPRRLAAASAPAGAVAVAVLAFALWPSHRIWVGWAAIVDRHSRVFALALAQDQNLPAVETALAIPAEADTLRTVALLRRAGSDLYDRDCPPPTDPAGAVPPLVVKWTDPADGLSTAALRRLQGSWSGPAGGARLWVRDAAGVCVGRGEVTHYEDLGTRRWFGRRSGVDVLVRVVGASPPLQLQLVAADGAVLAAGSIEVLP
jgi:putative flippase GtrA